MSPIIIKLNKENVSSRSITDLNDYMTWNPQYLKYINEEPGKEHYRMLAEISNQLPEGTNIADIGTFYGSSALALSSNPKVNVTTYDIGQFIPRDNESTPLKRSNITFKVMSGQLDIGNISKCPFVLLDIDPHDGPEETKFVQLLIDRGFRGLLACDDINLNEGMKEFWSNIPTCYKKVDVSHLAHWTGTGIVVFDPSYIDVIVE